MFYTIQGIPDEVVEKFRNAKNTVEFKRDDGEYCVFDTSSNVTPNKSLKKKFKPSEEVVTTGPMGKGLKVYKEIHYSTLSLT